MLGPDEKTQTSQQALKTWEEQQAGDGGVPTRLVSEFILPIF